MRILALTAVVSAFFLSACSTPSSSPEDLAKSYIESIVKNDKSLMAKVLVQSDMNSQHWNNHVERFKSLQADSSNGSVSYTFSKCWHKDDVKATFCQYSLDGTTKHFWTLLVQIKDGASKVESAGVGR